MDLLVLEAILSEGMNTSVDQRILLEEVHLLQYVTERKQPSLLFEVQGN